ncbi:AzlD domain-containing protein [Kallotenue papyrolyticum]|uniref:AzlD domain-containing protein n=1 Tax=Kallotenue papyrolyticum TaxID=1325125 RepID=UPI00049274FB|nr:AzlD domain-containing protein [Kallotenue papyrolyticum]
MNVWLTLLGMALVTYATRVMPLLTLRGAPAPRVERVLRAVPPAIFAALIVPGLVAPEGVLAVGATVWAGLLGGAVALLTRSMALTILAGLLAFAALRWWGLA